MKHLEKYKIFLESFDDWIPYQEIKKETWDKIKNRKSKITKSEFDEIYQMSKIVLDYKGCKYWDSILEKWKEPAPNFTLKTDKKEIYIFTIFLNSVCISKLEDEWWVVYLPYSSIWNDKKKCLQEYGEEHPWVYYKCDQLEGLKEFFDEKILNIIDVDRYKWKPNSPIKLYT